jgi:hypothetical protein
MHTFQPANYGPVLAPLVSGDRRRALDHGQPDATLRAALDLATVEAAFAHATLADRDMAACAIAGLWLVHDELDRSHSISQNVDTPTGAFWHGVMHRREGDYSNAKYWFRRVGAHKVLDELAASVAELAREPDVADAQSQLAPSGGYDPFVMVDSCQAALRSGGPAAEFCLRVQQAEWELLFDFCYRNAVTA